jgi:8-oxo-dGTP diphosphatase
MNTIHKVAGIILHNSKEDSILFQLRDDIPTINEPNLWVLPGGHIEDSETTLEGLNREIFEETSYKLTNPIFCFGFSHEINKYIVKYFFFTKTMIYQK